MTARQARDQLGPRASATSTTPEVAQAERHPLPGTPGRSGKRRRARRKQRRRIEDSIAELAIKIARLPERAPMTTERALEQLATTNPDESIRDLARRKLEELRGR